MSTVARISVHCGLTSFWPSTALFSGRSLSATDDPTGAQRVPYQRQWSPPMTRGLLADPHSVHTENWEQEALLHPGKPAVTDPNPVRHSCFASPLPPSYTSADAFTTRRGVLSGPPIAIPTARASDACMLASTSDCRGRVQCGGVATGRTGARRPPHRTITQRRVADNTGHSSRGRVRDKTGTGHTGPNGPMPDEPGPGSRESARPCCRRPTPLRTVDRVAPTPSSRRPARPAPPRPGGVIRETETLPPRSDPSPTS